MSYCSKSQRRSDAVTATRRALLLGLFALGGCGFRPLYGGGIDGQGPGALFGAVRVETEQGELGFRLRDALIKSLRPANSGAPLLLNVQTAIARDGVVIQEDDEITRFNLRLQSKYTLTRTDAPEGTKPLFSGTARTIAAYNATTSQYATLVAEREVLRRGVEDIADKIAKKLAASYDPAWLG